MTKVYGNWDTGDIKMDAENRLLKLREIVYR